MMTTMRKLRLIGLMISPFIGFSVAAEKQLAPPKDRIVVSYLAAQNQQESSSKKDIEQSGINSLLIELSNQYFAFQERLLVQYGGSEGPLYDPQTHTVHIPYAFYRESHTYFDKNEYQKNYDKSAQSGAIDTLLHTLLHEAGHAYIEDQKIAILGKEEDAVDNFATIILLNYVEHGSDVAISAADMFSFESEDKPDYYDLDEYIDEHSFDMQRYFATLCLVYGSDPLAHQNLLNELLDEIETNNLQDRKESCIEQFETTNDNWHRYLTIETD